MDKRKIAVVILNYNSEDDLFRCIRQLEKQKESNFMIVVVDNASSKKTLQVMHERFKNEIAIPYKEYSIGSLPKLDFVAKEISVLYNKYNDGYSAGNNIGIKFAFELRCDAVLIVNPDMLFEDCLYIKKLTDVLFSNEDYAVGASEIIGLDGREQNPFRESTFFEELFWFKGYFQKGKNSNPYLIKYEYSEDVITVPKVCGCCQMIKMDFLREINYLDENVFLYSEEAILSKQVKSRGKEIVFTTMTKAIHAHKKSEKANSSKRMLDFIKSRKYYIDNYSGYNALQVFLLKISYALLILMHKIKLKGL